MADSVVDPQEVTKAAKSNLAFALNCLPKERRDDMVTFYAFCRIVDDIADSESLPLAEKQVQLGAWKKAFERGEVAEGSFEKSVLALAAKHAIDTQLFLAVVEGCTEDLTPVVFQTWEALKQYNWKVACAVGMVSAKIFGCSTPESETYAVKLGHALQLTNILRDVGHDWDFDQRVYLPVEDMERFGYSLEKLQNKVVDSSFMEMMAYQAKRAENLFKEAEECLPVEDRKALLPARMMGEVYYLLLQKIKKNQFNVFEKVHRVSKVRKVLVLLCFLIKARV